MISAEVTVHPIGSAREHHELTLLCDDIDETVARLHERGTSFAGDFSEQRLGA
ncbi:MAG: hypothetical protein ABR498_01110 [Candidatus Dormibacteria bacterium]